MKSPREEAARWFAHMQNVDAEDWVERGRFERWLMADPAHAQAYQSLADVWDDFNSTARLSTLAAAAAEGRAADRLERRRAIRRGTLGMVVAAGLGTVGWRAWDDARADAWQVGWSTPRGKTTEHLLPDGSRLSLGPASQVEIRYEAALRRVLLREGVAAFDVASNPDRPFVVDSGLAQVRVLGTAFAVDRLGDERVRVSVSHGRVQVDRQSLRLWGLLRSVGQSWVLGNGQVVDVMAQSGVLQSMPAADGFAWRDGSLVFAGAMLSEVAARLSRYTDRPVLAPDGNGTGAHPPRIASVVREQDIDRFLAAMPSLAAVRVVQDEQSIRLYPL